MMDDVNEDVDDVEGETTTASKLSKKRAPKSKISEQRSCFGYNQPKFDEMKKNINNY